ncbi:hypothetical protein [Limnohabitans sp.]|uniref:hypothetical protein n=1 Tax=Limnohabitans sp. TaxID=1907725 RepID=UPI0035B0D735
MKLNKLSLALAGIVSVGLTACGGGSSSNSNSTGGTTPTTLQGTAATGAAFTGGTVFVYDSRGQEVGHTSSIDATTGQYTLTLAEGAVAPFVLVASRTTADGQTETLVSVMGSKDQTTANITPITSLIASRLSPSGDPTKLVSELSTGTASVTPAAITTAVTEINTALAPLLTATGTSGSDPITTSFTTNGASYDRLLDSISVSFTPSSSTTTTIDITAKTVLADGQQPVTTSFTNTSTSLTPLDPSVATATLVEPGTSTLINDLLRQLTTCFGLPLETRVSSGSLSATECRNAFYGNDPATFLSNGATVGLGQAFNGLFVSGGTGMVFGQGTYEFSRANGDIVAGYKSRDTSGNETFDTFVLRKDTDGKLKLYGNQYQYPGGVTAYQQLRQFITLNQSAYNYYSTGYAFGISNVTVSNASIFNKVVVTSPNNNTLVLKPSAGSSNLNLVYTSGTVSGTSFVRLARAYVNTSDTSDPKLRDTNMFFSPTPYSDSEIQAIPAQGVWKFDYYLAGNGTATPNATQYYKTRARAMTIAELRTTGLASLSTNVTQSIGSLANATSGKVAFSTGTAVNLGGDGEAGWTVTSGQLPPTKVTVYGQYINSGSKGFDDTVKVGSTARSATVPCAGSLTDTHCVGTGPLYAAGTFDGSGALTSGTAITGLHLWSRDVAGREFANFYAMYRLATP